MNRTFNGALTHTGAMLALLILGTGAVAATGLGERGGDDSSPGIRIVGAGGTITWALEEPQPGDEVVIVGRLAAYGNEPFTEISIDTFLDPEGARARRRYAFSADGVRPPELEDPTPPGLVRVRGTIVRVPGAGRPGIIAASAIEPIVE